jgi:hypothetical protein
MALMIDLARHAEGSFRSEDPLEAAKFVLSHAVSALWESVLTGHSFARFAERAAPQLIRWESAYGWSNGTGAGKVAEREIPLADVLAPMLETPDMWTGFADAYLAELDRISAAERPLAGRRPGRAMSSSSPEWKRSERTRNLARWNELLSGHIDAERAERLANHPAFDGPDADFLRARAARRRGNIGAARKLSRRAWRGCRGGRSLLSSRRKSARTCRRGPGKCGPNARRSRSSSRGHIRTDRFPDLFRLTPRPGTGHLQCQDSCSLPWHAAGREGMLGLYSPGQAGTAAVAGHQRRAQADRR